MVLSPLLVGEVGASGLEQTVQATWSHSESLLNPVCLFCVVSFVPYFFSFLGRVGAVPQYYRVVDDCTSIWFGLLQLNVSFFVLFFRSSYFEYFIYM